MEQVYKKEACCGCGLCAQECPASAIRMEEDELGFLYPQIQEEKCTGCGKCRRICPYNAAEKDLHKPLETFAAVRKDKEQLLRSSSGGVFASIAEAFLSSGYTVYGAAIGEDFTVKHTRVSDRKELPGLLGSKYVQSEMREVYRAVAEDLKKGKVLFSGTPCQVAAVKKFTENDERLFTIEIICHGVPNNRMFRAYLASLKIPEISGFLFRDKEQGWSYNSRVFSPSGEKRINHRLSSYMTFFMHGDTYRDSCFHCPYAGPSRGADLTIGDFWGVARKRPDLHKKWDIDQGVSCALANTQKGLELMDMATDLEAYPVDYSDIREGNGPLNSPSVHSEDRAEVLRIWQEDKTWDRMEKYWRKNDFRIQYLIWSWIPKECRQLIRLLLKKR